MTGDLAVISRPVMVERTPSAPAASQRPRPTTVTAGLAVGLRSTAGPDRSGADEPSAARLKALLGDPAVRVRAHRDDASARVVLQVVDRVTGEVIEQYPPDQLLRLYAALRESLGALVDECA